MSNKIALLIIDVQYGLVKNNPFNMETVIKNINILAENCRKSNIEIIHFRHCEEKGSEFEINTPGWEICKELTPKLNEKIIDKNYNSIFKDTKLKAYLEEKGISTLIMTGLQTNYCIDTSCRVGFEFGFKIIIPEETNTTFGNEYITGEKLYLYHNYKIFKDRFAKVTSIENVNKIIEECTVKK